MVPPPGGSRLLRSLARLRGPAASQNLYEGQNDGTSPHFATPGNIWRATGPRKRANSRGQLRYRGAGVLVPPSGAQGWSGRLLAYGGRRHVKICTGGQNGGTCHRFAPRENFGVSPAPVSEPRTWANLSPRGGAPPAKTKNRKTDLRGILRPIGHTETNFTRV